MKLGERMRSKEDQLKKDLPVLREYANHVAHILMQDGHLYEEAENLRTFLKNRIKDNMERTEFMHAVLGDGIARPQSLTYKAVLKALIQKQVGHIYAVEIEQYDDEDTSPQELIGDGESVNSGLKFEIRNTSLIK
ncbi:MAG: hypothetical protein WC004_01200 [Candidatus Absconditabacterales bacterium]